MIARSDDSIMDLMRNLKAEASHFVREEINLIKAELTEKFASYGRNAVGIAIGGALAYAGLIVLLAALGAVIGYGFRAAGLDPFLAAFIGLALSALPALGMGAVLLMRGLQAVKKVSPTPERTVRTLQQFKGPGVAPVSVTVKVKEHKDERTPEQVEASVVRTEAEMADTLEELADRVSLTRARQRVASEVETHPYRWGLIAAGCGAASSYILKRRRAK
jgi:hypothetical protein